MHEGILSKQMGAYHKTRTGHKKQKSLARHAGQGSKGANP